MDCTLPAAPAVAAPRATIVHWDEREGVDCRPLFVLAESVCLAQAGSFLLGKFCRCRLQAFSKHFFTLTFFTLTFFNLTFFTLTFF